jgi:hypothetical protein
MKARLYWHDGRIEDVNLAPGVTHVIRHGLRGEHRHFLSSGEADQDGSVRFMEEYPPADDEPDNR